MMSTRASAYSLILPDRFYNSCSRPLSSLKSFRMAERSLRSLAAVTSRHCRQRTTAAAHASEAPEQSTSASSSQAAPNSPKIQTIVDQISTLTLLEAADLVQALKTRLNITEVAYAAPSAPAPVAAAAPTADADAPAPEKPKEKTLFNVNLTKIDAAQKAKAIKEVKAVMPTMNLVEAKKFVESLPKVLKENATKDEAEKLKKALEAIGAEVTLD